jgi:hypothetical protein
MKAIPPRPKLPTPPSRSEEHQLNADTLSIMYVLLTHNTPDFSCRLINALDEPQASTTHSWQMFVCDRLMGSCMLPQHTFIVHVDTKSPESQEIMTKFAENRSNVFIMDRYRQGLNWGGFTIVNATLGGMMYGWETGRHFDFLIDLSGTHYPIKSNKAIREALGLFITCLYGLQR